jgi:hypothetical protein
VARGANRIGPHLAGCSPSTHWNPSLTSLWRHDPFFEDIAGFGERDRSSTAVQSLVLTFEQKLDAFTHLRACTTIISICRNSTPLSLRRDPVARVDGAVNLRR